MWKYLGPPQKNVFFINLAWASGGGLSKHPSGQLVLIVVPPKVGMVTVGDLFPNILVLLALYNAILFPLLQLSRSRIKHGHDLLLNTEL